MASAHTTVQEQVIVIMIPCDQKPFLYRIDPSLEGTNLLKPPPKPGRARDPINTLLLVE